jgi:hypothetical protein
MGQLRNRGWYPSTEAPVFHINGSYQHGGHISTDDLLSIIATNGTIWYTLDGSDPRLPATAHPLIPQTLIAENATKKVLVPTSDIGITFRGDSEPYDDSGWTDGTPIIPGKTGGVGYERSSGYENYISYDVESQMYGKNTSCYIRIPFAVDAGDLATFNYMVLRARCDDGFVAYINGVEVTSINKPTPLMWNSSCADRADSVDFVELPVSSHLSDLHAGDNILAIHGLNQSSTSSDFLISVELIAGEDTSNPGNISPTAIEYTSPITLNKSTCVKARVLSGTTWSALNEAVFAVGPIADNLRITEIMYHPQDTNQPNDPNTEFVELTNIGTQTINLNLVRFTNGIDFTFPSLELAAGEYVLAVKDINAFKAKYGSGLNIAGQYTGSLANDGERIRLQDAIGQTILDFRYKDNWYDITDGLGFSLTVKDPVNTEPNSYSDKSIWRPSAQIAGSPGTDDTGYVPFLGSVVINELLAHSHAGEPDWIELHNTTDHAINIGGWFLSDDDSDLTKYEIPSGTSIPAGGYIVFYEDEHFGNPSAVGCNVPFALSENGETLYLHSGFNGSLTGYSQQEQFGPSATAVAFGRYPKSTGAYNFVAMSHNSPGYANAYPLVGPVVINEIMYNPDTEPDAEYVELLNISDSDVALYDDLVDEPWLFTDDPDNPGIEYLFPESAPICMSAGQYILLVKDRVIFLSRYSVPEDVKVFQWGSGRLDNAGEKIQLSMPGDVDSEGVRQWIRIDRVVYSDGSHPAGSDPWPTGADGGGLSLSRKVPLDYGNDVSNWQAATPTPGQVNQAE